MLADTRCSNVVVLDVTGISPVTDFMVLATGTSPRQMKSAADAAEQAAETMDYKPLSRVGDNVGQWVVIDFVDAVVHLFNADSRLYYDLDGLWGDARKLEWRAESQMTAAKPAV